jgi:hypothetical protein
MAKGYDHIHTGKKTYRKDKKKKKKKLTNQIENLCNAREPSVQFFVQFFYIVKLHSLTVK